jgi:hypothetical protein
MDHLRDATWKLPWLQVHLTARSLRRIPSNSYAGPAAQHALEHCEELQRLIAQTGMFN